MGGKCGVCLKDSENKNKSKETKAKDSQGIEEKGPILEPNDIKPQINGSLQPKQLYNPQSSLQSEQFKKTFKDSIDQNDLVEISNLKNSGFPINDPITNEKFTPLHYACKTGNLQVTKHLIEKIEGVNINIQDENEKWTPLMLACMNGHFEIVDYLLTKKADKTLISDDKKTAQMYAKQGGFKKIVKLLKE